MCNYYNFTAQCFCYPILLKREKQCGWLKGVFLTRNWGEGPPQASIPTFNKHPAPRSPPGTPLKCLFQSTSGEDTNLFWKDLCKYGEVTQSLKFGGGGGRKKFSCLRKLTQSQLGWVECFSQCGWAMRLILKRSNLSTQLKSVPSWSFKGKEKSSLCGWPRSLRWKKSFWCFLH